MLLDPVAKPLPPDFELSPELVQTGEITNTETNSAPILPEPSVFGVSFIDGGGAITGVVADLDAIDPDGDDLTYEITGGEDGDLFSIDPTTVAISLEAMMVPGDDPMDTDGDKRYFVEVGVSDGQATTGAMIELFLNPGSVPNLAPFLLEPVIFGVPEGRTFAAILNGFDPEGDDIHYAILSGEDASQFTIDSVSGRLNFIQAPDFEAPTDADQDNTYLVDVQVSDDTAEGATQTVTVHVRDGFIPPPPAPNFLRPGDLEPFEPVRTFLTSATSGAIMDLQLVDDASDFNDFFRLVGEDADRFSVDPGTGLISLLEDADLTSDGSFDWDAIYEIVAVVEDAFGGSDTMAIDFFLLQGG